MIADPRSIKYILDLPTEKYACAATTATFYNHGSLPLQVNYYYRKKKKPGLPQVQPSAARPSWSFKTRRFPSPSLEGFGFIAELFICSSGYQ